ncbi:MAG: ABC transporter permease [Alistipes sp.]|jgi:putative ABC transport system permease protein|nr:ABC transporter permease [Alistipes sp.]
MKFFDTDSFEEIWATITRNKFRSIATGFGVFWGLFMLIVLVAVGNKLKQGIMGEIGDIATNSVFFQPSRTSEAYMGYRKGRYWDFDSRDIELIRQKAASVDQIAPVLWSGGADKNVVRGMKSGSYTGLGVYPAQFEIEAVKIESGRLLNEVDVEEARKVCVIGKTVYETLFAPGEVAEGQYVRFNGIYFQVVGVVSAGTGAMQIMGPVEELFYMPFSTNQRLFQRSDSFWFLTCTAREGFSAAQVETEVGAIIRTAHNISPTDTSALWTLNVERIFNMFRGLFTGVNILMWIVGLGALFSGIIGISNIMLVTVRERMREIGVRRALGAKPWNIIVQVMSESFVLTAIAGMLGFLVGVAASLLVDKINLGPGGGVSIPVAGDPIVSFGLALTAMGVLMASGLVAGLLPAMRALQIKAIDAIRDE